ncbi:MAG TPA: class 1 isoprenoid biosynthesis enzyme [Bacteroidales bacterium]|nr:class 1 isoprenoid biosynthesis enzyme [Bacteroidales bacterium]
MHDVARQKAFVNKVIENDIVTAINTNDGTLDEEDFSKIRDYYGFGVPAIVGEGICSLRGQAMSHEERQASTYQGALTGLYDDFFDKSHLSHGDIRTMMEDPFSYNPASSLEILFIHFLRNVLQGLPDKAYFTATFDRVYQAQVDSHAQEDPGISWDKIREITFRKGGVSLLFYRSVFRHKLRPGEEDALYNAGSLMQLGNDIFDVYKDHNKQIMTFMTRCNNIDEVRREFNDQLRKTIKLIKSLDYRERQKRSFLHKFLLGISRCWVCLDQLERLEIKTNGVFRPPAYSRDEMICDMEKPANMIRSIRYYLGYRL